MDIKTYTGLRKLSAGAAINAYGRNAAARRLRGEFKTPSSDTELRNDGSDPIVRLQDTAAAGRAIADNAQYAKEFSAVTDGLDRWRHKLYLGPERFRDIPAAAGWGPGYSRKSTFMCMPFVSECFSKAHGGRPLWNKRTGRPALTKDINKALALNTELPIDMDNFHAYVLNNEDTVSVPNMGVGNRPELYSTVLSKLIAPNTRRRTPADILPGFVKIRNLHNTYGGGWGGHAGVTHGQGGTYQASTSSGVKKTPYVRWGFRDPKYDKAFTVMGKDVSPEQMARSLYKYVAANSIDPVDFIISGGSYAPLKSPDSFINEFKTMNAMRNPRIGYRLPSFYHR